MHHFMLDIETLGTAPGSVVLSVGAVKFDLESEILAPIVECSPFYSVITLDSSLKAGCTVDGRTLNWWMQQSPEAREAVFNDPKAIPLRDAASAFAKWSSDHAGPTAIWWAKSSPFDFPLLDVAFRRVGIPPIWNYRKLYDMRVISWLYEKVPVKYPAGVTAHHALHDAWEQAYVLKQYFKQKGTV